MLVKLLDAFMIFSKSNMAAKIVNSYILTKNGQKFMKIETNLKF